MNCIDNIHRIRHQIFPCVNNGKKDGSYNTCSLIGTMIDGNNAGITIDGTTAEGTTLNSNGVPTWTSSNERQGKNVVVGTAHEMVGTITNLDKGDTTCTSSMSIDGNEYGVCDTRKSVVRVGNSNDDMEVGTKMDSIMDGSTDHDAGPTRDMTTVDSTMTDMVMKMSPKKVDNHCGSGDESEVYEEEEVTHEMWNEWTKSFRQRSLSHSESEDDELIMPVLKKQRLGLEKENDHYNSMKSTNGKSILYYIDT